MLGVWERYTRFALMAVFRANTIEIRISYSRKVDSKTAISAKLLYVNIKKGILLSSFVTHSLLGSLAAQAELGDAPKIYGLVFSYHDTRDSKTNIKNSRN